MKTDLLVTVKLDFEVVKCDSGVQERERLDQPGRMANCFWSSEPISAAHRGPSSLCRMSSEDTQRQGQVID